MDVIRIRSLAYPSEPEDLDQTQSAPLTPSLRPTDSTIAQPAPASSPVGSLHLRERVHRQWKVSVQLNARAAVSRTIQDPFLSVQYMNVFEQYLRNSDQNGWSPQNLDLETSGTDVLARAEEGIQHYAERLLAELKLDSASFSPGVTECHIIVAERHDGALLLPTARPAGGIHCLAWELLEGLHIPSKPQLRFRVTRETIFPAETRQRWAGAHGTTTPAEPRRAPRPLAEVQRDPRGTFRVLLVVARNFDTSLANRDPEPDLAQWPLMTVKMHRDLRQGLLLEVVRPGSLHELERHLAGRAAQDVWFTLVHFDLHGRLDRDERGDRIPWLMFARQPAKVSDSGYGYRLPDTHPERAEDVAQLLASYQIENVVLNACLSAYNRRGHATNLAHIFLKHGIVNVSAMWYYVHWQTVMTYLESFYEDLFINGTEFHRAAQNGREALRQRPTHRVGRDYQDFFLCVNYTTNRKRTTPARDHSVTPSQRSSTSSMRSFRNAIWKPQTAQLADTLPFREKSVVARMELRLLELEYKLLTFRVVYATDRGKEDLQLSADIDKLTNMWLSTNMVNEVRVYKAKDFAAKPRVLTAVRPRELRRREPYLQRFLRRPVPALRHAVHLVREVDEVLDPGTQLSEESNTRNRERRRVALDNLARLAERVRGGAEDSFVVLLGSHRAEWWHDNIKGPLGGDWWPDARQHYTEHSRVARDGHGAAAANGFARSKDKARPFGNI